MSDLGFGNEVDGCLPSSVASPRYGVVVWVCDVLVFVGASLESFQTDVKLAVAVTECSTFFFGSFHSAFPIRPLDGAAFPFQPTLRDVTLANARHGRRCQGTGYPPVLRQSTRAAGLGFIWMCRELSSGSHPTINGFADVDDQRQFSKSCCGPPSGP